MAWDKDAWILDAVACGYLKVYETSEIWKHSTFTIQPDGSVVFGKTVKMMAHQTHKATGRVYVNITWRETPGSQTRITKSVLVNRVVALCFLPNPLNLPQVNHIDGVKAHNYLRQPTPELREKFGEYQLEWSTGRDNETHAHRNGLKTGRGSSNSNVKLTADDVLAIRASADPVPTLMQRFGVGRSTIVSIINRKTWVHV